MHLPAARFALLHVTNDVMVDDGLHYVTIFMRAEVQHAEAEAVANLEPDKCAGWAWSSLAELRARPLFLSLENMLAEVGGRAFE